MKHFRVFHFRVSVIKNGYLDWKRVSIKETDILEAYRKAEKHFMDQGYKVNRVIQF